MTEIDDLLERFHDPLRWLANSACAIMARVRPITIQAGSIAAPESSVNKHRSVSERIDRSRSAPDIRLTG
jgi:hypothetical protein